MKNFKRICFLLLFSLLLVSCSSSSNPAPSDEARQKSQHAKGRPAPAGTKLSKIREGMNDAEVNNIMGYPNDTTSYMTGKAWIPFYFGPDTTRTDWLYRGQGRVVFSRNHYSGGLKVIRVDYNPDELK